MTTVTMFRQNGRLIGFETKDHTGFAEEGRDVVCAAVSAATELAVTILESAKADISVNIDPKTACVRLRVNGSPGKTEEAVLDGYGRYMKDVSAAYPLHVFFSITEV